MKLIELVGSTGSGKTTIARALDSYFNLSKTHKLSWYRKSIANFFIYEEPLNYIHKLVKFSPNLISLRDRLAYWIYQNDKISLKYKNIFLENNLRLYFQVLKNINSSKHTESHKVNIRKWFLSTGGIYQFFQTHYHSSEHLLFDEGFLGIAVNQFSGINHPHKNKVLENYLKLMPEIDVVINLKITEDECYKRLKKRNTLPMRLSGFTHKEILNYIHSSNEVINSSLSYLKNYNDNLKIIEIDNSKEIDSVINSLILEIKAYINSKGKVASID